MLIPQTKTDKRISEFDLSSAGNQEHDKVVRKHPNSDSVASNSKMAPIVRRSERHCRVRNDKPALLPGNQKGNSAMIKRILDGIEKETTKKDQDLIVIFVFDLDETFIQGHEYAKSHSHHMPRTSPEYHLLQQEWFDAMAESIEDKERMFLVYNTARTGLFRKELRQSENKQWSALPIFYNDLYYKIPSADAIITGSGHNIVLDKKMAGEDISYYNDIVRNWLEADRLSYSQTQQYYAQLGYTSFRHNSGDLFGSIMKLHRGSDFGLLPIVFDEHNALLRGIRENELMLLSNSRLFSSDFQYSSHTIMVQNISVNKWSSMLYVLKLINKKVSKKNAKAKLMLLAAGDSILDVPFLNPDMGVDTLGIADQESIVIKLDRLRKLSVGIAKPYCPQWRASVLPPGTKKALLSYNLAETALDDLRIKEASEPGLPGLLYGMLSIIAPEHYGANLSVFHPDIRSLEVPLESTGTQDLQTGGWNSVSRWLRSLGQIFQNSNQYRFGRF